MSTGELSKTVMVYNTTGELENKLKAHSNVITSMSLVPGTNDLMTAAFDGSFMFNLPTSPDQNVGKESAEGGLIGWCDFLPGGDQFASLNEDGKFEIWDTNTLQPERCAYIEGGRWTAVHPTSNHVAVYSYNQLHWLDTVTMETVSVVTVHESDDVWIWDVHVSGDGRTCLVATYEHGAIVFDIEDLTETKQRLIYVMEGKYMQTAHIHSDNVRAVTGGSARADLWNMESGDRLQTLYYGGVNYVKFLHNPDRVLYANGWGQLAVMDLEGEEVISLSSVVNNPPAMALLNNGRELMTGELNEKTISVHDVVTGEVMYAFVEHRSTLFNCLAVHPSNNIVLAYNQNGIFYILKTSRD